MGKGSRKVRSANQKKKKASKIKSYPEETLTPLSSEADLEAIYGKRGPPVVDALGRVNGRTFPSTASLNDDLPDFLKEPKMITKTTNPPAKVEEPSVPTRKVSIFKDHTLDYPCLCLSVFVQPDPAVSNDEARFAKMFARAGCKRAPSVLEADLVVFGGGSDVDPVLYHEKPHKTTYPSKRRDENDMALYLLCLEHGIPMLGICRGAQFLHVMNGGKLFQDVDGHYGDHSMWDINRGKHIEKVSSVHHQMVMENVKGGMEIIATAAKSNTRWINDKNCSIGTNADIEAFFYKETGCIGIQGHPEYEGYNFFTRWSLDLIEELVYNNPDFAWIDKNFRMKPELLKERDALSKAPKLKQKLQMPTGKKEK